MISDLQNQLRKSLDHLRSEFAKLQIGTANASIVDRLEVESYGTKTPLQNLANISCPDPKTVKIEPWDKSLVGEIERAIVSADLGLNPQNMGEFIFVPIPPMTEERRRETVKLVHAEAETAKISIRNIRHDAMKKVKTQKDNDEISEDEQKKLEKQIQEKIDDANREVDELAKKKEANILEV